MSQTLAEVENEVLADGREWTRRQLEQRLQAQADQFTACLRSGWTKPLRGGGVWAFTLARER
jgi:hypothetical protein